MKNTINVSKQDIHGIIKNILKENVNLFGVEDNTENKDDEKKKKNRERALKGAETKRKKREELKRNEDDSFNTANFVGDLFGNKPSDEEREKAIEKHKEDIKKLNQYGKRKKNVDEAKTSQIKKKYINHIYKAIGKETSHFYKDDAWQGVSHITDIIADLPFVIDLNRYVENGGYHKDDDGNLRYKQYELEITCDNDVVIKGDLKCHAAGTISDPFDRYDITVVLY